MLKKDAVNSFKRYFLPDILKSENGIKDYPMRREAWNNYTNMLCKNGYITDKQYNNWTQPKFCKPYNNIKQHVLN